MDALIDIQKRNDLVFDVGMHRAEDTEFYLRKGFRVVAFEANPELVEAGKARFNHYLDEGKLTIVAGAIVEITPAAKAGEKITFYQNEGDSVWGTTDQSWMERNLKAGNPSRRIEVEVVDFAAELQRHGVPRYLKVDIEGSDTVCLEALRRFREKPDFVSIESDKTSFEAIADEIALLRELGYKSFQAVEQSEVELHSPPQPAREGSYVEHSFKLGSSGLFGEELGGEWISAEEILRQYRFIRLGYHLLGDDGAMYRWRIPGCGTIRRWTASCLRRFTRGSVPGWYDTHARLALPGR